LKHKGIARKLCRLQKGQADGTHALPWSLQPSFGKERKHIPSCSRPGSKESGGRGLSEIE